MSDNEILFNIQRFIQGTGWVPTGIGDEDDTSVTRTAPSEQGVHRYRINTTNCHGNSEWTTEITVLVNPDSPVLSEQEFSANRLEKTNLFEVTRIPTKFSLDQNYPNPFNPSTTMRFSVPHDGHVTLGVFNMLGQRVAQLADGIQSAGHHEVVFNAEGLSSGVYFMRLEADGFVASRKIVLAR